MPISLLPDGLALVWFLAAWIGFGFVVDRTRLGDHTLSRRMDKNRRIWAARMLTREVRIVDTAIMASLQNGTAFFASTSLLAVGAAFTLLNQTDRALEIFAEIPFHGAEPREVFQLKALGLVVIYGYAFFKFGWSYRLFNYAAILIGAVPNPEDEPAFSRHGEAAARRFADMQIDAGHHFHWGLRAFFFSIGYIGWFVNAWIFMATTTIILGVLMRRQFLSHALRSLEEGVPFDEVDADAITARGRTPPSGPRAGRRQAL